MTDRISFMNLRHLQEHNTRRYQDMIHHPGPLSDWIVDAFLAALGSGGVIVGVKTIARESVSCLPLTFSLLECNQ